MGDSKTNFISAVEICTDGGVKLFKYKSKVSGITVFIAETDGPLVAGYLTFAVEAHDDDGLPHTLEHMVFLGSEKYPYKGLLDLIANRCLASGTNAWTDTDHICFTMTTAGDEGFLKLLPIYMDHLLFPTLTDSAYITEVHHINGEGEDAGVVYCEMHARENSGESRCYRSLLRAMYPGHCGYKSETGGLLKNLRESTTNEKVRAYHEEYFRPENLCIVIVGQIDPEKVFEALKPIEDRILDKGQRKPFTRPWQSPIPPLEESVLLEVDYPCEEDESGLVLVAWRGPLVKDYSQIISIQILLDYLTDTSVSPLKRDMVEIEDPFCNSVDYSVIENAESCIYLDFSNVPIKKLSEVKEKLFGVLKNIADGVEPLDMERMKTLIKKRKLYILSSMESCPHEQIAMCLIADFLYGSTLEDLRNRMCEIQIIDRLFEETSEFWIQLLKTYIVERNSVVVLGKPSCALSSEMTTQEEQRIANQKETLGDDGLKLKAEILKDAIQNNKIPPPEVISCLSVPSVKSIKFHPIQRICSSSSTEEKEVNFPVEKMPCRFQLDNINTKFVRIYVLMDTSDLSQHLRLYLPLFVDLLDECAVKRNGEIIPYEEVVKQLAEDTISISASLGRNYSRFFCQQYAQVISLELMVEEDKYNRSVQWIREILYHIVFEPKRIQSSIKKMMSSVASMKRRAGPIIRTMMKNMCYCPESNHWSASMMRQHKFLSNLQNLLDSNPDEVIKRLNEVRESITKADKMTVHLSLNVENLKKKFDPAEAWLTKFLPSSVSPGMVKSPIKHCYELLRPFTKDATTGVITSVGSVESSYLLQWAPGITSYTHPDYPALLVLIQYLTQSEGPIWSNIRGPGLAYTFGISVDPSQGLIYFIVTKSTNLIGAYKAGMDIIESHMNGKTKWENSLLESGCSSLIFEFIETVKTVADVSEESVTAYYKDVDMNYLESLLDKFSQVTTADMERVGTLYLRPLFDPKSSKCAICCHPSKEKDIVEGFKVLSRDLTVVPSLDESFLAET